MKDFLRKAFDFAHNSFGTMILVRDHIGCFTMRLMIDESLFDLRPERLESPLQRRAATLYGWGMDKAQEMVFDQMDKKICAGDFSPKPDIKPGLIKLAKAGLPYVYKWGLTQPAMITVIGAAAVGLAGYALYYQEPPPIPGEAHRNEPMP